MSARLFIGIALPHSMCKQLAGLPLDMHGAKCTSMHNFHLTLAFIGEVESSSINAICQSMRRIHCKQFPLAAKGIGRFDKRILWAGVTSHAQLHPLQAEICTALNAIGVEFDHKPFRPHITLARLRNSTNEEELDAFIAQHKAFRSAPFTVQTFQLFESKSTAQGVQYTPLVSFPLSPS
jgi:2'-5' RNA ligase